MKFKWIVPILLVVVLLTACSGVEMVPAPQSTPAPTRAIPATQAVPPAQAQPAGKETPALIAPFDETPNPHPDDQVKPHPTGLMAQQPLPSFDPQPGDAKLQQGPAFVDHSELVSLSDSPYRLALHITGSLPTPCHQLRVKVDQPDRDRQVAVSVYTVVNPDMVCTQVIKPFEISVPVPAYPAGNYQAVVNGQKVGDFTMP